MSARDVEPAVRARLEHAGAVVDAATVDSLAKYLTLLARWNRRINLTAFDLEQPTEHAIDRLIVEPVLASVEIGAGNRVAVDVGSGGGSPALPLKIVLPRLRMTLIEARVRKSAFLREAVRELGLGDVRVETFRLDRNGRGELDGTAEIVTVRAVRADADVLEGVAKLLAPGGRLLWFNERGADRAALPSGWSEAPPAGRPLSFLRLLTRSVRPQTPPTGRA